MMASEHAEFIIAAYAAFALIWLGLILETWLYVKRSKKAQADAE